MHPPAALAQRDGEGVRRFLSAAIARLSHTILKFTPNITILVVVNLTLDIAIRLLVVIVMLVVTVYAVTNARYR
jgi:hypothetical protein